MKNPVYRFLVAYLAIVVFLLFPVQADMIHAVKTHVYFQKDGIPYNDSVAYTVKCYGVARFPLDIKKSISEIYTYSATCTEYGCAVWQPDTYESHYNFDHCELEGVTLGRSFVIRNISVFAQCTEIPIGPFSVKTPRNTTEYYYITGEVKACKGNGIHLGGASWFSTSFRSCNPKKELGCLELFDGIPPVKIISNPPNVINDTTLNPQQYRNYLATCDPVTDQNCPGWIIDGKPLKKNPSCLLNTTLVQQSFDSCYRFAVRANPALILPEEEWRKNIYQTDYLPEICDAIWTIPPDNRTLPLSMSPVQPSYAPLSPVESLYCWIVQLSGGRCE